jgi:hypothetical protein
MLICTPCFSPFNPGSPPMQVHPDAENRQPPTPSAGADYREFALSVVGDRDPLSVMERLLEDLRTALGGLSGDALRREEAPGKWSIGEVVAHLADTELVYGYRLRKMLAEERPDIQAFDHEAWARHLLYRDTDLEDALDQLAALRRANLRLLGGLAEADWDRAGVHSERGEESVRTSARMIAAHDMMHLRQIARIRAKVAA